MRPPCWLPDTDGRRPGSESGGRGRATWETFHSFTPPPPQRTPPHWLLFPLCLSHPHLFLPALERRPASISHHLILTRLHAPGVFPLPQLPLTQTGGLPLDFRENRIPRSERPAQPSPARIGSPYCELPASLCPPSLTSNSEGGPLDSTSWNEMTLMVLNKKKTGVKKKKEKQQCFFRTSQDPV